MSDTTACKTPMADHIADFWELLATEHVRILIDIRRDHDESQPPHWDSSSFPNDVAKAIAAERDTLVSALKKAVKFYDGLEAPHAPGEAELLDDLTVILSRVQKAKEMKV